MASKQPEQKPNRILEILRTEYPLERVLLGVLGALVLILGVYLIEGSVLTIRLTNWWIFDAEWKRLTFAILLTVIGTVALIMSLWPFFVPSFAEMRKVTWPNRSTIANNSARVFGFIIFISLFFVLIDLGLRPLFEWINTLGQ